jgi:hypothetical protein
MDFFPLKHHVDLKHHADFGAIGAGTDEVSAAKGRQEIVEGRFIREIHRGKLQRPPDTIGVKEVIGAYREIEQVPRCDAGRVGVVVFRAGCGDVQAFGAVVLPGAQGDGLK